jgi:hypothetical protein
MSQNDARSLNDARWKLVDAVKAKGALWDSSAKYDAIESARRPLDEELRRKAVSSVSRADHANDMAKEIIKLIHEYWPKSE